MKLPDRFILAFPYGANKYIYYNSYWVDMVEKTITRTCDDYHGSFLMCRMVFNSYGYCATELLENRIIGKPARHKISFISDGMYDESNWFHQRSSYEDDKRSDMWPIRFEPYAASFVDGDFVEWIENKELDELHDQLARNFRYSCSRIVYDTPFSEWKDCEAILTKAFQLMSHCQVVMRIDRIENRDKKIKNLKDLYENLSEQLKRASWMHSCSSSYERLKLIETIFPPRESKSAKKEREVIRSCVQRFVRRHPTLATTNLLKMIAGMSGLTKSASRFARKSPLPLAS